MGYILVTGGAGFIGSVIAGALADRNVGRIVVCDQFGNGDKWRNLSKHRIFEIIGIDELTGWLADHTKDLSAIVHMGASSSTTESNADFILQHNFTLSRQLWN